MVDRTVLGIGIVFIFFACVFVGSGTTKIFDINSDKNITGSGNNTSNTKCVRNYVPELYYYEHIGDVVPDYSCQSARFTKYTYGGETLINIGIVLFLIGIPLVFWSFILI